MDYLILINKMESLSKTIDLFSRFFVGKVVDICDKNKILLTFDIISDNIIIINELEFYQIPGFSKYYVSKCAKVYSTLRKKLVTYDIERFKKDNAYIVIYLINDQGLRKQRSIHSLVAETFLSKNDEKLTIDHIDRNKYNNHLNNLRYATTNEQSINKNICQQRARTKVKITYQNGKINIFENSTEASLALEMKEKTLQMYIVKKQKTQENITIEWYIEPIENEVWKNVIISGKEYKDFWCSTEGRFKNKNNRLLNACSGKRYKTIGIDNKDYFAHRLVAMTFIENKNNYEQVDHINRNPHDNRVCNLRWVNRKIQCENRIQHKTCLNRGIPVLQINSDNEIINEFPSIEEATKYIRQNTKYKVLNSSHIVAVCNGNRSKAYGFKWMRKNKL